MIYKDEHITKGKFIRSFSECVEASELMWHRDKRLRKVKVLEGTGWKIQFDNELPQDLEVGSIIMIPKMVFHRLWKGTDNLVVEIEELDGI